MIEISKSEESAKFLPACAYLSSLLVVVLCFSGMLWFESRENDSGWLQYILIAPLYLSLQILGEALLGVFCESGSWLAKLIPIAVIIAFYAI